MFHKGLSRESIVSAAKSYATAIQCVLDVLHKGECANHEQH